MLEQRVEAVLTEIDTHRFKASLASLSAKLDAALAGLETMGGYRLRGVEVGLELELTAEGGGRRAESISSAP